MGCFKDVGKRQEKQNEVRSSEICTGGNRLARQVILAVAGAGKTYHICHGIDPHKRNLILTYTNENVRNIVRELKDAGHGNVPDLTDVMTFDSFVYRYAICPFNPSIRAAFSDCKDTTIGSLTWKDPPPQRCKKGKKTWPNPLYKKNTEWLHYVTESGRYYGDRLCELIMRVGKGRDKLVNRVAAHLNSFYDFVAIDEFQDFRCHKYDFMVGIAKKLKEIILVGDYYQHSVSGRTNHGKPFDDVEYDDFVKGLKELGFDVDATTLSKSRRCADAVCAVVRDYLNVKINGNIDAVGSVIRVTEHSEAESIFRDKSIPKLVYDKTSILPSMENTISWGTSKGDTYMDSCVILKCSTNVLMELNGRYQDSDIIRNKLYVALTRAKRNVYLVGADTIRAMKNDCVG